jgi:hypothetical protein
VGSPGRATQIIRGKSSLTRAIRTGVVAVWTGVGQHRFLQSFGAARSKASGWAANGLRMELSGFSTGVLNCITSGQSMCPSEHS